MSLESADPHDSDVLREKSNLGKIREKLVDETLKPHRQ